MFVADVQCPQVTWQTVPNSRANNAKASVSKAVVRTWYRAHVIRERPKGSLVAFGDEMDVVSQVDRHLTAQCLVHQTGEFELHSPPNRKPVQLHMNLVMSLPHTHMLADQLTNLLHASLTVRLVQIETHVRQVNHQSVSSTVLDTIEKWFLSRLDETSQHVPTVSE